MRCRRYTATDVFDRALRIAGDGCVSIDGSSGGTDGQTSRRIQYTGERPHPIDPSTFIGIDLLCSLIIHLLVGARVVTFEYPVARVFRGTAWNAITTRAINGAAVSSDAATATFAAWRCGIDCDADAVSRRGSSDRLVEANNIGRPGSEEADSFSVVDSSSRPAQEREERARADVRAGWPAGGELANEPTGARTCGRDGRRAGRWTGGRATR